MKAVKKTACTKCKRPKKILRQGIIGALSFTVWCCPNGHEVMSYRLAEIG